jgi:hypothetical protein
LAVTGSQSFTDRNGIIFSVISSRQNSPPSDLLLRSIAIALAEFYQWEDCQFGGRYMQEPDVTSLPPTFWNEAVP